jgi:FkbM family methyltransferase
MNPRTLGRSFRTFAAITKAFSNWPECLLKLAAIQLLGNDSLTITWRTRSGWTFEGLRGDGSWVVVEVYALDAYRLRQTDLPMRARIVDIGANIGVFSIMVDELFAANVLAFEPAPAAFSKLRDNVNTNPLTGNVVCNPIAIVGNDGGGTIKFYEAIDSATSSVVSANSEVGTWIDVPCASLDKILSDGNDVDLLKIDIEGAEYSLIRDASVETLRRVRKIVLEYHPTEQGNLEMLVDRLRSAGFAETDRCPISEDGGLIWFDAAEAAVAA